MPVPRQRLSSRRGRTRAAHHALHPIMTSVCAQCKKPTLPHMACPACGYYKSHSVYERAMEQPSAPAAAPAVSTPTEPAAV